MNTSKIAVASFLALFSSLSFSFAEETFFDDFNRANTNGVGGGLGPNWDTVSTIFINGEVAKTQTAANQLALFNGFDLSESLEVNVDAYAQSAGRYVGIVFNYTDADNYYVIRTQFNGNSTDSLEAGVWQFLKKEDGAQSVLDSGTISPAGSMPINTFRSLSLNSTENEGEYLFEVTDVGGATTYLSETISDSTFGIGGQVGFQFSSSFTWADNFSVTTVPEPGTYALTAGMAALMGMALRRPAKK